MNSKNVLKEKMLALLLIFAAAVILIFVLLLVLGEEDNNSLIKHTNKEISDGDEEKLDVYTYPPDDPRNLEFRNLENGKCSVSGIGNFKGKNLEIPTTNRYGAVVVSIDSSAFDGCKNLEYVFIPHTVQKIGDKAFKGCASLKAINVDSGNVNFCSKGGILYSEDLSLLMYYPPKKTDTDFLISEGTVEIADYAFDEVVYLRKILYAGTTSEFEKIRIGIGNLRFTILPITCNYQ